MSAFFVGNSTINAVCSLMLYAHGPRELAEVEKIGSTLWMMNALAVDACYAEINAGDYLDTIQGYRFEPAAESAPVLLKSLHCFLHQCSEGDIPQMALFKRLEAIAAQYDHLKTTPEYDRAPWGLCEIQEASA